MAYRDEVLADSPLLYLPLDGSVSNDGSEAVTLSPSALDYEASGHGQAAVFNGDYIDVTGMTGWAADKKFTIEFWFKCPTQTATALPFTADLGGTTYFARAVFLNSGAIQASVRYNSTTRAITVNGTQDNQWHHYVLVSDDANGLSLWIDGVLSGTSVQASGGVPGAGTLYVGSYNDHSLAYTGSLDEFAVYDHALSPARIAAHFDPPVAQPPKEVESGPANTLALVGTQGPTISLGAVVEPPVEVLSGWANTLSLNALLGPTLELGTPVVPPKEVESGWMDVLEFRTHQGPMWELSEPTPPEPEPETGEWFFEVLMPAKAMDAYNPTASLEVRNSRKRLRPELKTLVRA